MNQTKSKLGNSYVNKGTLKKIELKNKKKTDVLNDAELLELMLGVLLLLFKVFVVVVLGGELEEGDSPEEEEEDDDEWALNKNFWNKRR